ncbi:MAG TPA: pyridoxamine 5'-phosphate oxidase family protein, partial [Candidatus Binatia bacterium]|nr:pyridoxamine 5'-phosphate oxidase family protein [Candidatus Binatia bacterium]
VAPNRLKRLKNIQQNSRVSLVIDHYDEDWRRLAYVMIAGTAEILDRGARHQKAVRLLRRKYPQYRSMAIDERPMVLIKPARITSWGKL